MYKLVLVLVFAIFANATDLTLLQGEIQAHTEVFGDSTIDPKTKDIKATLTKKDASIESVSGKFSIKVLSLVSDNKDRDEHMYEVLNENTSPKISFTISKITKENDYYKINGYLTMNNVGQPVSSIAMIKEENGNLSINGDFAINLTDFNLEPPSMFFLTVRDKIDIKYSFDFKEEL